MTALLPNERIAQARAALGGIERAGRPCRCLPFGIPEVDRRLAGRGLAAAALHEAAAASPGCHDDAAATLFLAAAAARAAGSAGHVLWALSRRDLFAPALAAAGLPPDRLFYAECRRDDDVLAVMEEGVRQRSLAAVVGEAGGVTLAAARRLQLAAEEAGTMALLLRRWRRADSDPLIPPSSAVTRWRIAALPAEWLAIPGVGRARWRVALVRQRGGEAHEWILEAPDAEARLALFSASPDRSHPARRAA